VRVAATLKTVAYIALFFNNGHAYEVAASAEGPASRGGRSRPIVRQALFHRVPIREKELNSAFSATMATFGMTPGIAGLVLLAHTAFTKVMMTALWRGPGSAAAKMGAPNWMEVKDKLENIPLYVIMSASQLNEAEYAGPFMAALFFLSTKGIAAPWASWLAVLGQILYYWPRVFLANEKNFNNGFPFYVPGALMRYASLVLLCLAIYPIV